MTLAEEVRNRIASDIVSGRLKPGQRLEETVLAAEFKVSRTPVRDALRQLGVAGLVEVRPRRGVHVATISAGGLQELFEAQSEIEAVCAQLTAMRCTAAERGELELLAAEESADPAPDHEHLHDFIYRCARNEILTDTARALRSKAAPFRMAAAGYTDPLRVEAIRSEHARVVAAILAIDPAAAHDAMKVHISRTAAYVIRNYRRAHPAGEVMQ